MNQTSLVDWLIVDINLAQTMIILHNLGQYGTVNKDHPSHHQTVHSYFSHS